LKFMSG